MTSNKKPISWHEEGLANWRRTVETAKTRVAELQRQITRDQATTDEYAAQIEEAKRRGLTAFDRDRFGMLKSRSK